MAFLKTIILNHEKHLIVDSEKRKMVKGPDGKLIKDPSITKPGKCLPLNQLIKQVGNGTIQVNPALFSYDFPSKIVDSSANTPRAVNEELVKAFDGASEGYTDPTVAPNFEATDAEAILAEVGSLVNDNGDAKGGSPAATQKAKPDEKPNAEPLSPSEPAPTEG